MQLRPDPVLVDAARLLSRGIASQVATLVQQRSTVSIERSIVRLCGISGATSDGVPLANVVVERLDVVEDGIGIALGRAIASTGLSPVQIAEMVADGERLPSSNIADAEARAALIPYVTQGLATIIERKEERASLCSRLPMGAEPLLYVIVATGNIFEDLKSAVAAVEGGAQIIAVIRSTGQSLLDYVPDGCTTEGFGGTYATQANFRLMRETLDETSKRLGRYVMLTNYASGLCMPEIALLGAFERLDMLLNDALYGILFRDINGTRTLIDQHASRRLLAYAGIILNTGEDNYLTVADAVEHAPTVLASQFINEALAHSGGMLDAQIGLGDAFEIDPAVPDSLSLQIAQSQLAREIFPNAPLKYMPPTRYMTGNIFRGTATNTLFNLTSILTRQSIHLCGMMTEAIHNPHLADRILSIENARYVFQAAENLASELEIRPDGLIARRASDVLKGALEILTHVRDIGLIAAIGEGVFADIHRAQHAGRGGDGVFLKSDRYWDVFADELGSA